MRALSIACWCACCVVAIPLASPLAQNSDRKSRILGVVGDSVNKAPLRNAEVIVSGLATTFTTDSLGKFTIDSIPPGKYQLGVFHPVLESLGITLATSPFVVGPDSAAIVNLSVPSVPTLVRRYCGSKQTVATPSSFAGLVLDPESDAPIAGAKVSLAWTDITVSKQFGVVRTPHEMHTETNSAGFFKLCALPSDLTGTLQVRQGGISTPEVPVAMGGALLAFQTMSLPLKAASTGRGVVTGHVFLENGQPVAGARVQIPVSDVSAVTREDGAFRLTGVQTGTQVLIAMNLGFATASGPINVTSREPTDVVVTLAPKINVLDPVLITASRSVALEKAGFNSRRRTQHGYFITREDIERRKPNNITDMLRNIPGVNVSYQRGGVVISGRSSARTGCTSVVIDGFEWQGMQAGDLDMVVNPDDVIGLEVYEEYDAPPQYNRNDRGCLTVVIWRQVRSRVKS